MNFTATPIQHSPAYSDFNIKYGELSSRLTAVKKDLKFKPALSSQCLYGETRTFAEILDQEVEKVVLFYLRSQGLIAGKAWELRELQLLSLQGQQVSEQFIEKMFERYRNIGNEVLCLLAYLDYNVNCLRRIINRHDAIFDVKMGPVYFKSRFDKATKNSALSQLHHQEGIRAIIGTLRRGFEELHEAKCALEETASPLHDVGVSRIPRIPFKTKMKSFSNLEQAIRGAESSHDNLTLYQNRSSDHLSDLTSSMKAQRPAPPTRKRSVSELEPIFSKLEQSSSQVLSSQERSMSEMMMARDALGVFFSVRDVKRELAGDDEEETLDSLEMISGASAAPPKKDFVSFFSKWTRLHTVSASDIGLIINLMLTFCYMANQYVIAPTSSQYASLLGMSQSLNGLIIGLQPVASLLGTLVYSIWSNYCFKPPLISCITFSIIGNLCYAMALQCNSPYMIFIGRLCTGFGGTRGISRRYIADHISFSERTIASSQFVTAGALGLAAGPLGSSLLTHFGVVFEWKVNDSLVVLYRPETAASWIMSAVWFLMLLIVYFLFEDPKLEVC
jgi:hypothetical protein